MLRILLLIFPILLLIILFFNIEITLPLQVVRYNAGNYIYSNRNYIDSSFTNFFNGSYLIRLDRHQSENIILEITDTITIYRLISSAHLTDDLLELWKGEMTKVRVRGITSVLDSVVSKKISQGTYTLISGSANEAWPVLINTYGKSYKVRAWYNKTFFIKNIIYEFLNFYEGNKYPPFNLIKFYVSYYFINILVFLILYGPYVYFVLRVINLSFV